jgi:hypothetical protein
MSDSIDGGQTTGAGISTAETCPDVCPFCGQGDAIGQGYGLAAGGMGAYAVCDRCEKFIWVRRDREDE